MMPTPPNSLKGSRCTRSFEWGTQLPCLSTAERDFELQTVATVVHRHQTGELRSTMRLQGWPSLAFALRESRCVEHVNRPIRGGHDDALGRQHRRGEGDPRGGEKPQRWGPGPVQKEKAKIALRGGRGPPAILFHTQTTHG